MLNVCVRAERWGEVQVVFFGVLERVGVMM